MCKPVISLTVWNTSSFLASRGGMFLKTSLWGIKMHSVRQTAAISELHQAAAGNYPRIPVTRKWRLPWILVQLMKLSMLLESTVCLCSAPVPSHTAGMDTHCLCCNNQKETKKKKSCFYITQPFGQSPLQSSHCLWPPRSTSILSGGQTLTQELPSTTK